MKRAFTIFELLVVIAMIAFVAFLIIPLFTEVRDKSRQSSRPFRARVGDLRNDEWRQEMIRRDLAEFNPTNGQWQWKASR